MNNEQRFRQQAAVRRRHQESEARWNPRRARIENYYFKLGWTQKQIAAVYGVSQGAIAMHMKKWGIDVSKLRTRGHRNGRYKDGSQSRAYRHVITKDKCFVCESKKRLCIHHLNGDHYDNRLENLQVLCVSCHLGEHKRQYWAARRAGVPTPKSNAPAGWLR